MDSSHSKPPNAWAAILNTAKGSDESRGRLTRKAPLWLLQFFEPFPPQATKAECLICRNDVSFDASSKSNLKRHVKRLHEAQWQAWEAPEAAKKAKLAEEAARHFKMGDQVVKLDPPPAKRKAAFDRALGMMICMDGLPLSFCRREGFLQFCAECIPGYIPPTPDTLRDSLIPTLYSDLRELLQEILINTKDLAACVDLWSSRAMTSFMGITLHLLERDWTPLVIHLECREFHGSHTGERIWEDFDEICGKWGIRDKVLRSVTDTARNMLKFAQHFEKKLGGTVNEVEKSLDVPSDILAEPEEDFVGMHASRAPKHIPCTAHKLQLVVKDGLAKCPISAAIIRRVSRVVASVKKSTADSPRLRQIAGRSFKMSCPTRWNSVWDMLNRFFQILSSFPEVQTELNTFKAPGFERFTPSDLACIKEILLLLAPFKEATDAVQGDAGTISCVLPALCALKVELSAELIGDQGRVPELRNALRSSLDHRFKDAFNDPIFLTAAAVDPRWKLSWVPDKELESRMRDSVLSELRSAHVLPRSQQPGQEQPSAASPISTSAVPGELENPRRSFFSKLRKSTVHQEAARMPEAILASFESLEPIAENSCPFKWWAAHEKEHPELASLARRILTIPASSGSAERLFSTAGFLNSALRSQLSPSLLNKQLFVYRNHNLAVRKGHKVD